MNQIFHRPMPYSFIGPNCFGRVKIILVRFKLDFSGLIFIIWMVQNHFGPIEGQGIRSKNT